MSHADDISILAPLKGSTRETLMKLDQAAEKVVPKMKEKKTKIMTLTKRKMPFQQNVVDKINK